MALLCEECDESHAVKYCASCEQKLCNDCDIRIHNKGKRAQHVRGNLMAQKKEYLVSSQSRAALPQMEVYNQGDLKISVFQQLNFAEEIGPKELTSLQSIAADYYIQEAYKGNLMHEYEDFKKALFERFQKQCQPISKADFEDLFLQVKSNNFFHITVRKFGDMKPLRYCSLLLESISLESLTWILLSIKNDKMKPTDKLVLSRIKEYFLLKLSQKDWNSAMDHFYAHPACLCPSEHLPKLALVDERETSSKVPATAKSDTEQNKEDKLNSSYHFEVQHDRWDFEDILEIEDNEDEDWVNFKKYIDEFFGEEAGSTHHDSRSRLRKQKNTRNIQKWLSSVENDLTKPTSSLTANHSLQKILTEQSISRAIPGGKYGCALMIKLTGPAELQPLSLGKLCSFVQKALNQNILIYYKTLLIRNNQYDGVCSNTSTEAKNSKKVEILKEQILSLLRENKNGLSLAQIPLMLKNKYKKTYNIQSLGFPKLKNLLATMDEVDLEKTQGNFLKAVLKVHCRKNSDKNLDEMYKSNLAGKKFHTLRPKPLDNRLNSMHYNSNLQANLLSNDSAPPVKAYRTVSTLDDYIFKIQSTVLDILRLNIFGIEVEKLKAELDRRLGADFHYGIAKVNSFQEFLINYLGDYLDIEIKKSLRTGKSAGPLSHIVYPKNYKLPQPPKNYFPEEDAEEQQVGNLYEKFSNMSPGSLQHYLQSPDLSFANNLKQFCSPKHQAEDDLKISQSFNVGRNCEGARLFADTLSQQAGSSVGGHSGAQAPLSTKSTRFVNEYTHFGKLHVLKGSKIYTNEFRQRIKDASRTTAVSKKLDEGAGSNDRVCLVSFDNEEEAPQARGDSDRKNTEQVTVSKSTVNNEEASDEDPSLRVVANLLLDED